MKTAMPNEAVRPLLLRLWRDYVLRYRSRLGLVLVLTVLLAGIQALYPIVIDHA